MQRAFFIRLSLALLVGLVLIYVFDSLKVSALSYPVCLSIVVMGVSLREKPMLVVAISTVYIVLVTYSALYFLYHSNPFNVPLTNRVFGLVQREGVFIVVCAMGIYLSFYRNAAERTLADLQNTLSKIPVPVVISDGGGYIIYVNDSLKGSFENFPPDLIGKRYIDFFMPGISEGHAMRYYIELFSAQATDVHEIDVVPFGYTNPMRARLTCHGSGMKRTLITVLQPPDTAVKSVFASDSVLNRA